MNENAGMYFGMIAERFWKEEVILTPCEKCKRKGECFSQFDELTDEKLVNEVFEKIRHCNIRNRALQG